MLEKSESCPICEKDLDQTEYDFQFCRAGHWTTAPIKAGKPHIEIEDMEGCKQAHLICNGWKEKEVDGKLLWTKTDAFDARDLITDDALTLQKMIDAWGETSK